jgi:adenylylsulfate reductase subunit A
MDIIRKNSGGRAEKQPENVDAQAERIVAYYENVYNRTDVLFTTEEIEEAMQKVMDEYAGGIASNYAYNEKQLHLADEKITKLTKLAEHLGADNMHELLFVYELKERLLVCRTVIAHLLARKETRWHSFNENRDYPETRKEYFKYVNSRLVDDEIQIIFRDIVEEGEYEHSNSQE